MMKCRNSSIKRWTMWGAQSGWKKRSQRHWQKQRVLSVKVSEVRGGAKEYKPGNMIDDNDVHIGLQVMAKNPVKF